MDDKVIEIPYKNKVVKKYTEDEILGYERRLVFGYLEEDEDEKQCYQIHDGQWSIMSR